MSPQDPYHSCSLRSAKYMLELSMQLACKQMYHTPTVHIEGAMVSSSPVRQQACAVRTAEML